MIIVRRETHQRDWTWMYIVAFALVACSCYTIEKEIEVNQLPLQIDYN